MNEEMTDARLKSLFDFQRFAGNSRLAGIIENTEKKYKKKSFYVLSDSDLEGINAAGNIDKFRAGSFRGEDDGSRKPED